MLWTERDPAHFLCGMIGGNSYFNTLGSAAYLKLHPSGCADAAARHHCARDARVGVADERDIVGSEVERSFAIRKIAFRDQRVDRRATIHRS